MLKIGKATALTVLVQFFVYIAFLIFFNYLLLEEDTSGKELGGLLVMMITMVGSLLLTLIIFPLIGKILIHFEKVNFLVFLSAVLLVNIILALPLWFIIGAIWWGGYILILGILTAFTLPFLPIWWLSTGRSLHPKINSDIEVQ